MPLTGQAKTDYQREYMRRRRSNKAAESVRPVTLEPVRPDEPEPQSYCRFMVGVPPEPKA